MYTINVKFEQKGLEPITIETNAIGDSLLEVILDNGTTNCTTIVELFVLAVHAMYMLKVGKSFWQN
jgi:hypothetical protein